MPAKAQSARKRALSVAASDASEETSPRKTSVRHAKKKPKGMSQLCCNRLCIQHTCILGRNASCSQSAKEPQTVPEDDEESEIEIIGM